MVAGAADSIAMAYGAADVGKVSVSHEAPPSTDLRSSHERPGLTHPNTQAYSVPVKRSTARQSSAEGSVTSSPETRLGCISSPVGSQKPPPSKLLKTPSLMLT